MLRLDCVGIQFVLPEAVGLLSSCEYLSSHIRLACISFKEMNFTSDNFIPFCPGISA